MNFKVSDYFQIFRSRKIAMVLLLGFSSGLPITLALGTLQAWMTTAGVDLKTIGIVLLAGLPYTIKFLWSPFMDRFVPPWFGRRRGWIIITQLCLVIIIILMAFGSPATDPLSITGLALILAFCSASQDIVIDAYRTDVLKEHERGIGAAVFVMGYRIALIVSGALALILSDQIGWRNTYLLMAGLMSMGIIAAVFAPEPDKAVVPPRDLQEAVWGPLKDLFTRDKAAYFLLLIVLYKLCDAYAGAMLTPFLIRGVGFTPTDVGAINKMLGIISVIIGGLFGGTLMLRLGLFRSLMVFGILQAISILSFMVLAWMGKNYGMLVFAVAFENFTGGMGTTAFLALLMTICNQRFSATQYALLSSLAALGRTFIAPTSGFIVSNVGWANYFLIATLTAIPGLWLLWRLRFEISGLKNGDS